MYTKTFIIETNREKIKKGNKIFTIFVILIFLSIKIELLVCIIPQTINKEIINPIGKLIILIP